MQAGSKIVIVGGGVAGLVLATQLCRRRTREPRPEVVLVDRSFAHVWKPMLHTFAAGTREATLQHVPFLAHAARCGFRYMPGALDAIDRERRVVRLAPLTGSGEDQLLPAREVPYDALVLATGSKANDFCTPGVSEHCAFIDDLSQAEAFNRSFYERILQAAAQGRPLDLAVVGGGATGVELAAELTQWAEQMQAYNNTPMPARVRITLLESGPRLLAGFAEPVSAAALGQLRALGVQVRLGTRVVSADQHGFELAGGGRIDAQLRLWAAGVRGEGGVAVAARLEINRVGQIVVGPTLQSSVDARIFALGDCASLTPRGAGAALPPTAQVARQQALHASRAIPRLLAGASVPVFRYRDLGALVSLAKYNAYGTLGRRGLLKGRLLEGAVARAGHALLYRLHQVELHGLARAALVWASDVLARAARPRIRVTP
ncbi:NAD(P)/FAD-dependent oxidoreductase [Ramlibacter henchirensis]|uniref:NAD(P)/FAD-dependent oxidoreductase n=1 Tax=Ramlibacter henchirensis TaxID=204072 RepID=A0A4Z0C2P8_9BURK|nr:FAD-dependent oxidoreductase [Ramlibacter henchirensis]TFZ05947.1 NAD(P)/FAD-dependent oxidoreductase [Ramlibacter henchirensis]